MAQKNRYNVSLPDHVSAEIEARAKAVHASPTEYAGDVIRWWFGQGCPPINKDEEEQRKRGQLNAWSLDPSAAYNLVGDAVVTRLMEQLGVPNLFAPAAEHDEAWFSVTFDNHPTHWIVLNFFKGSSTPGGDGLLFRAYPKSTVSRQEMMTQMREEAEEMGSGSAPKFSQIPSPKNKPASNQATTGTRSRS